MEFPQNDAKNQTNLLSRNCMLEKSFTTKIDLNLIEVRIWNSQKYFEKCPFQITADFCVWLRELPEGDDQTVNNIAPDKIRSMFDTHSTQKVATSKVAEGLRSWYVKLESARSQALSS